MNMLEALKIVKNEAEACYCDNTLKYHWARPISWKNWKMAFTWNVANKKWKCVPTLGPGGSFIPGEYIFEEWEVIDPDIVNNGE